MARSKGAAPVTNAGFDRASETDAKRPVVVLCREHLASGTRWLRPRIAAYSLSGGLNAWKRNGFKLLPPSR
jgi:rhodanese-related sulfurtransferase